MSYLERLKAEVSGKALPSELTKPTKAPSVSFVSAPSRHVSKIEVAHKPELLAALASEPLPDHRAEARRQRVLAMLAENPTARYAVLTHDDGNPEGVTLTLAIRGQASCELRIPRDRYDPFLLLDLIERNFQTVH